MNNPTIENVLNLALDATPQERARSENLDVGFDSAEKTWELIVKYSGPLDELQQAGITVTELLNEYAVLLVPENLVELLAGVPEIEYIEKPKRLFFSVNQGKTASCITAVQSGQYGLYGEGVLVALLDSGVDYAHPDFRNEDGTTRIVTLWDQTIPGRPPEGYRIGTEYTAQEIDEALTAETEAQRYALVPSRDISGHGTRVLGIAAGNGRAQRRTLPGNRKPQSDPGREAGNAPGGRLPQDHGADAGLGLLHSKGTGASPARGSEYQYRQYLWSS